MASAPDSSAVAMVVVARNTSMTMAQAGSSVRPPLRALYLVGDLIGVWINEKFPWWLFLVGKRCGVASSEGGLGRGLSDRFYKVNPAMSLAVPPASARCSTPRSEPVPVAGSLSPLS